VCVCARGGGGGSVRVCLCRARARVAGGVGGVGSEQATGAPLSHCSGRLLLAHTRAHARTHTYGCGCFATTPLRCARSHTPTPACLARCAGTCPQAPWAPRPQPGCVCRHTTTWCAAAATTEACVRTHAHTRTYAAHATAHVDCGSQRAACRNPCTKRLATHPGWVNDVVPLFHLAAVEALVVVHCLLRHAVRLGWLSRRRRGVNIAAWPAGGRSDHLAPQDLAWAPDKPPGPADRVSGCTDLTSLARDHRLRGELVQLHDGRCDGLPGWAAMQRWV
jgi:hypothetical protein